MTSILITGGAGFTGRHIVAALADAGHRVVSYNRDFLEAPRPDVAVEQGELFDVPRLLAVLRAHEVEAIVHTAAMSHPTYSLSFPIATFAANMEGTVAVFEAARLHGVTRIVNFSSETVYGENPQTWIDESSPVNPSTPYAVTKVAGEWLGRVYGQRFDVDVVSLRIAQVYGPGNRMDEIVRDVMRGVVQQKAFAIDHGADHPYNLVYVKDVARAARAAVEAPHRVDRPLAYNISSDERWTLGGILKEVETLYPDVPTAAGPGLDPTLDPQGQFEITAAADHLGFRPEWPLRTALPDYGAWLADHPF
ncbi:NAD-dependent epimerase/dehydratase family protein [Mycolicibacterium mengxianglii]|uniref:NAD-dependent epimerase/dehydratase family protein n=1 Tax=Mycolicibacterium mengxianglii TaxID=2736649 RepID=UPI0018D1A5A0|nr:NAD(P)-dependent oxidoreductase [Mycolicibacterium mengxianglii]